MRLIYYLSYPLHPHPPTRGLDQWRNFLRGEGARVQYHQSIDLSVQTLHCFSPFTAPASNFFLSWKVHRQTSGPKINLLSILHILMSNVNMLVKTGFQFLHFIRSTKCAPAFLTAHFNVKCQLPGENRISVFAFYSQHKVCMYAQQLRG